DFQHMAGWINWGLNVEPCFCPSLASMYETMAGKDQPHQLLWISWHITRDLSWLANDFASGNGIYLLDAIAWGPNNADAIFTLVLLHLVLEFGCLVLALVSIPTSSPTPTRTIFFFEAFAISCAIHITSITLPSLHCVAVFSNNNNSIEMFNTM
ncbi:hypothetical protein K439DRAFT_1367329, partial [Ramaria rubella]